MNNPVVSVRYAGKVVIVEITIPRLLEDAQILSLEETLNPLVEECRPTKMIIDFSRVEHLSSSALGVLIRINSEIKKQGGFLSLCGINKRILEIFKITKLDQVFTIRKDVSESHKAILLSINE
ncbi:STAS domain-containing protein [Sedimentisphaera salicampi]|uniref:Anti-sigma factor antagonist n=1 Tax=Sedimentisphaera salicampi TaxID=1941349 RepID=A0A1W6LPC0_9BACT|nr:STAS domain-containing protein [Sedimentisphaera salicampi]ARN57573.1 Anti-anti-sigma-B factor [Sedimentisphaera salicampi]OXU14360.1 Anti-anti-sigma-B factor [Sedimentisphaera salicampi]